MAVEVCAAARTVRNRVHRATERDDSGSRAAALSIPVVVAKLEDGCTRTEDTREGCNDSLMSPEYASHSHQRETVLIPFQVLVPPYDPSTGLPASR